MFEIIYTSPKSGIVITDYRRFEDHGKALSWIRRKGITKYILKPTNEAKKRR